MTVCMPPIPWTEILPGVIGLLVIVALVVAAVLLLQHLARRLWHFFTRLFPVALALYTITRINSETAEAQQQLAREYLQQFRDLTEGKQ